MSSPFDYSGITANLIDYKGRMMIRLEFAYSVELIAEIKVIPGRIWSVTNKCWYVPDTPKTREKFNIKVNLVKDDTGKVIGGAYPSGRVIHNLTAFEKLSTENQQKLRGFQEWMEQHRYSDQTIRNYLNHLSQFLVYLGEMDIDKVNADHVVRFNHDVIIKNKLSISYQRVMTGAIKLFYSHYFDHVMDVDKLDRPFREKTLPIVLSKMEVERIIKSASNIKHKSMLSLMYSSGLRRGELLNLKINDLDKERNLIRIIQGKGFTP
jgi:integrase/recombinase XerD